MKRLFALISAAWFVGPVQAQPIVGIGEIKIGISQTEFLELPTVKGLTLVAKTMDNLSPNAGQLMKTTVDSPLTPYLRVYSPDIVNYNLVMPIGVPQMGKDEYRTTVTFFRGRLTSVHVFDAGMNIVPVLTEKYGPPEVKDRLTKVVCQNGYGATSQEVDGVAEKVWGDSSPLTAAVRVVIRDCGKRVSASYSIKDNVPYTEMNALNENGRKALEAEALKGKAKSSPL